MEQLLCSVSSRGGDKYRRRRLPAHFRVPHASSLGPGRDCQNWAFDEGPKPFQNLFVRFMTTGRRRESLKRKKRGERERESRPLTALRSFEKGRGKPAGAAMAEKLAPEKRHAFVHNGQVVFEWDQTLEEVNMYIELPKGVPTKLFHCTIEAGHIEVAIRGNPPYLNHDLTHPVKTDSSFWTIEDGEMHITMQKREKGKTWSSPIQGQGLLDPYAADQEQKRLMLQRFQEENPGFDFSQAQFSGNCPDPRTFMGGIRSD